MDGVRNKPGESKGGRYQPASLLGSSPRGVRQRGQTRVGREDPEAGVSCHYRGNELLLPMNIGKIQVHIPINFV